MRRLCITVNGDDQLPKETKKGTEGVSRARRNHDVWALEQKRGPLYHSFKHLPQEARHQRVHARTLRLIANALHVILLNIINGSLTLHTKRNFIDDSALVDPSDLPKKLKNSIAELEDYDRENNPTFYPADTMMLMAHSYLAEGVIDTKTYALLSQKYPIA